MQQRVGLLHPPYLLFGAGGDSDHGGGDLARCWRPAPRSWRRSRWRCCRSDWLRSPPRPTTPAKPGRHAVHGRASRSSSVGHLPQLDPPQVAGPESVGGADQTPQGQLDPADGQNRQWRIKHQRRRTAAPSISRRSAASSRSSVARAIDRLVCASARARTSPRSVSAGAPGDPPRAGLIPSGPGL